MRLSRRASWLLIAFAIWSWIIWVTLIKNINNDPRAWNGSHPTGFLMVHVVLAVISLVMGTAIGWLGWKGLRAVKASDGGTAGTAGAAGAAGSVADAAEPDREKV